MAFAFDNSGKVKKPTAEEIANADKHSAILAFINGTMADGRPFYAYVAVIPSKYQEFYKLTAAKKTFVIKDYGKVIKSGFTSEPPPKVVEFMREKYGFDEQYVEKLKENAEKEAKVFFDQQEVKRIDNIVAMLKKNQKPS